MFNIFNRRKPTGLLGPDPEDPRDYMLSAIQPTEEPLPDIFDLRASMMPISDQNYGSCTAHGSTGVKEFWDKKNLSEKFTYYNTKKLSGIYYTEGDFTRNALKSLAKFGAPPLEAWPDRRKSSWEEYVHDEPPQEVYRAAYKYRAETYWRVKPKLDQIRQAIYKNKSPVVCGSGWYRSHYDEKADGYVPPPSGKKYGGHAYSCVGWENGKLWFRNSHGLDYGKDGYFYVPFEEFDKHEWYDFWIMLDIKEEEIPVGWMAGKYLDKSHIKFRNGDLVSPNVKALNVRRLPDLDSEKLGSVTSEDDLEIIDGPVFEDGYYWYKARKI